MKYEVPEFKDLNIEIRNGEAIVTLNGKQLVLTEGDKLDIKVEAKPEPETPECEAQNIETPEHEAPSIEAQDREMPKRGAGYADYAKMFADEELVSEARAAKNAGNSSEKLSGAEAKDYKEKSGFAENYGAALKITLTDFRGSKKIFKSLKNTWYDKEIQVAIKKINGMLSTFIFLLGTAGVLLYGSLNCTPVVTTALTIAFIVFDLFLLNPFMIYLAAPKPIKAHIKEIDKLSGKDLADYQAEKSALKVSTTVQRIIDRHDEHGNMIYK